MTSTAKLGVVGGSNGGVMAAAVTVQRPDLVRAAIAQVPIADALARVRDPITMGATLDYGDPNDPEISEVIAAWSPYQNIRSEEHTSELQSLMRISYAVYCLKQKISYTLQRNTPHISGRTFIKTDSGVALNKQVNLLQTQNM